MIEANLSASLLVLGILLLRKLLGTRLSRNCIYAVWLFVPLRLFLFSVFNIRNPLFRKGVLGSVVTGLSFVGGTELPVRQRTLTAGYIADKLWLVGFFLLAAYYAVLVVMLLWKVKRASVPAPESREGLRVRIVRNRNTAFLFGNTIYCSEKIYQNPEWMRYVTLHEEEHAKQADQLWGLLRIMLLCSFWYNPFVWVACYVSKQDCELACDERVVKRLSGGERRAYGKALLEIATDREFAFGAPGLGQEISGGSLKARIFHLYGERKKSRKAVLAVVLFLVVLTCITIGTGQVTPAAGQWKSARQIKEKITGSSDYYITKYN